jgi:hypothetical protein
MLDSPLPGVIEDLVGGLIVDFLTPAAAVAEPPSARLIGFTDR